MSVAKSTDDGSTWTRRDLSTEPGHVHSIAVDPFNPNIVYAAGYYKINRDRVGGVFKSTDGGLDWTEVGTSIPKEVFVVCVDPYNTSRVYAGTDDGLHISTDAGISWQSPTTPFEVRCMVADSTTPNNLFVGTRSGVSSSTDGGACFTEMNAGLWSQDVQCMDFDPTNRALYVGTFAGGVFRYLLETPVDAPGKPPLPSAFAMHPNYPNPFNASTDIRFSLSKSCFVTLKIYNLMGREIQTLTHGQRQAGEYTIRWEAADQPSGIYIGRLRAGDFVKTRKLVLQK